MALSYQALMRDLAVELLLRVWKLKCDDGLLRPPRPRQTAPRRHKEFLGPRIRDGWFELRKMRGEVNRVDLFTRHLSSEERIISIFWIFECKYEGGQAAGASERLQERMRSASWPPTWCTIQSARP